MRPRVQSLALLSGLRINIAMNRGMCHRHGLNLALLWLWCRLAAAPLIQPLAWERPYATGVARKRPKKKKKKMKWTLIWVIGIMVSVIV